MTPFIKRTIGAVALALLAIGVWQSPPVVFHRLSEGTTQEKYALAKVDHISDEGVTDEAGMRTAFQDVTVKILTGSEAGSFQLIKHGGDLSIQDFQKVSAGEYIVVINTEIAGERTYFITESFRLAPIIALTILFLALVLLCAGRKGLLAILGCLVSFCILIFYVVPQIIAGANPFVVSLIGGVGIVFFSVTIAHGFHRRTFVAIVATLITLALAAILSKLFVEATFLNGAGTEEAFFLKFGPLGALNLKGLLLAGIIIGVIGVLDDVTTAQAAAIEEIHRADPKLPYHELVRRGTSIGNEHIASLVNTLVLAYAGSSFPLFLIFSSGQTQPLWVLVNSEFLAEEIVRTLVGSATLVLAVPITTALAAWYFSKYGVGKETVASHRHH